MPASWKCSPAGGLTQQYGNHEILQQMEVVSKTGKIESNEDKVYSFLADFNHFRELMPGDKVSNWSSDTDHCHFSVAGIGETGLRIIEKQPFKLIKITTEDNSSMHFLLWIQLKQVAEKDTRIRITLRADLNPVLEAALRKSLQSFVDNLTDQIASYPFDRTI